MRYEVFAESLRIGSWGQVWIIPFGRSTVPAERRRASTLFACAGVKPGELASTPTEFKPADKEPMLAGGEAGGGRDTPSGGHPLEEFRGPSWRGPDATPGSGTPLEKLKGGNPDVEPDSLTPKEFEGGEPLLEGGNLGGDRGTPGGGTPLEKLKGGDSDVKADSLKPTEFVTKEPILQGQPSTKGGLGNWLLAFLVWR